MFPQYTLRGPALYLTKYTGVGPCMQTSFHGKHKVPGVPLNLIRLQCTFRLAFYTYMLLQCTFRLAFYTELLPQFAGRWFSFAYILPQFAGRWISYTYMFPQYAGRWFWSSQTGACKVEITARLHEQLSVSLYSGLNNIVLYCQMVCLESISILRYQVNKKNLQCYKSNWFPLYRVSLSIYRQITLSIYILYVAGYCEYKNVICSNLKCGPL